MIFDILKPESILESILLKDPALVEGLMYGKSRPGHPEGKVIFHVREVLDNVDNYSSGSVRRDLRVISFIHDSFKYKVNRSIPRTGDNHHAVIARKFAEKYFDDENILEIIEFHDEAYNSWQKGQRHGDWDKAQERANSLISRMEDNIGLYLLFYRCDNETGDKSRDSYLWFEQLVTDKHKSFRH
jgi:hypothetical protein